ncbi:LysE family translocator [Algirhabdus cladophorae]|uniref:LysE family translocator n=1 Tax=Algirhabdus cladophorae TaxID=3377108 RepID=UPI003B848D3D
MQIDPLYIYVFFGLLSPGPNVILLTASGARFGFLPTLPHILGVAVGVGVTAGLTGFGIGALLLARPSLEFALKCLAAAWILYMAYTLWRSTASKVASEKDRPFTFVEAVLFQWVNPKVWAVALSASSAYAAGWTPIWEAARLGSAFSGINLFVCISWTFAGTLLSFLLSNPSAWRVFMRIMAVALGSFAVLIFL